MILIKIRIFKFPAAILVFKGVVEASLENWPLIIIVAEVAETWSNHSLLSRTHHTPKLPRQLRRMQNKQIMADGDLQVKYR